MPNNKQLKSAFNNLYKNIKVSKRFNEIIEELFTDVKPKFNRFQKSFNKTINEDAKQALKINRAYFDVVQNHNQIHSTLIEQNQQTITEDIRQNDQRKEHFFQNDSVNKAKAKLILSNAEIDSQSKIIIAEKKVVDLIAETNKEIEIAKEEYLQVADKLNKERDQELETLSVEYQKGIDKLRVLQTKRHSIYEAQIARLRLIREQYVFYNSEDYRRIKENHTNFSIVHNNKIDELSTMYRHEIKIQNDENQLQIATVQNQINLKRDSILKMESEVTNKIEKFSEDSQIKFNQIKSKHDEEIRLVIHNQKLKISEINNESNKINNDFNKQIDKLKNDYEVSEKTKLHKKELNYQVKDLNKQIQHNRKNTKREIELVKFQNNNLIQKLNSEFALKKYQLDVDFLSYELNALTEKERFIIKTRKEIALLNLTMEVYEEEKNKKIALLTDAYNQEIAYLERILAIGSINQETMIQDQVGENSYLLADNIYQNNMVRTSFQIDSEHHNLLVAKLKIKYQEDVQLVTSYYQLLIQKEMVKRDSIIKQYDFEVLIAKEKLKKDRYEILFDYESLRLRTQYDLEREISNNSQRAYTLDYLLNLKKIKLNNITQKREANLQLQTIKAKANRNYKMYTVETEKNDRFYFGLIDFFFDYQNNLYLIKEIISTCYENPNFSVTELFHLIDLLIETIESITTTYLEIINLFFKETDEFFEKKMDELTGFNYLNKQQQLLNTNNQSVDIIRSEIKKITHEKTVLETNLNNLDAIRHRDYIQITNLTKNIKLMRTKKRTARQSERILRLLEELSAVKKQNQLNNHAARQYEKQIHQKNLVLRPLEKRLSNLARQHENDKKRLYNQLTKDALIYHRQKSQNAQVFKESSIALKQYGELISKGLNNLKDSIDRVVNAVDVYQEFHTKHHQRFTNIIHQYSDKFREVLLGLHHLQVKEQTQIVDNFHLSYATLIKNLNNNYETNYNSEKRENDANNKKFLLAQNRLHANFFHTNNQVFKTFESRNYQINEELQKYDTLFQKAYTDRQELLRVIDTNGDELLNDLENNTNLLIKENEENYKQFVAKKQLGMKNETESLAQLYEDTEHRSNQYRFDYFERKKEITNSLKEWKRVNKEQIKERERDYKEAIKQLKNQQATIIYDYNKLDIKEVEKLKRSYNQKINQISLLKF